VGGGGWEISTGESFLLQYSVYVELINGMISPIPNKRPAPASVRGPNTINIYPLNLNLSAKEVKIITNKEINKYTEK